MKRVKKNPVSGWAKAFAVLGVGYVIWKRQKAKEKAAAEAKREAAVQAKAQAAAKAAAQAAEKASADFKFKF